MKYRILFWKSKYGQSPAERFFDFEAQSDEVAIEEAKKMDRIIMWINRIWGDEEEHWQQIYIGSNRGLL